MNGFDAIAALSIAEMDEVVFYQPVSRIMAGGWTNSRPAAVAVLGVDLLWDTEDIITWDDGTDIGWEA
jgi:hypothetical protein